MKEHIGRKRIEDELRELNQSLERRVAERTAELEAINDELEAFSYSVSHDLRAPLRAISGFSAMLEEQCAAKLDEEDRKLLARILLNAERMGRLIDDLLDLSRVAQAKLKGERVNLSDLAEEIVRTLREREPHRAVAFVCPPGVTAWGDARMLRIALENLLGNAWKYTGMREKGSIVCAASCEQRASVFSISDNGAGFDMAHAGKLFGAFQRLHSRSEFEGTGIGLALVKRIVARHGGRIWANAAPDRGATFSFALPEPMARG